MTLKSGLGVIGTNTDQSNTCDFLLTLHNNHGPISYCYRDKQRFQLKIANFSHHPCILLPCWRGSPQNWASTLGVNKLEWWYYHAEQKVWWYLQPSGLWIQSINVTDRQTDGHRATAKTTLMHSSVVTIVSEPASIDYDRSFEKNRDVDVNSMSHGHVDWQFPDQCQLMYCMLLRQPASGNC